jgi:antitoxin component YwqK of YwqJK toxin-antitoxin module
MKISVFVSCVLIVLSCTETDVPSEYKGIIEDRRENEVLEDTIGFEYNEWYPGKKQLRIEGIFDANYLKHGKWVYYSKAGRELSITTFTHGLKQGFSIVKHPNGMIHYRGQYDQDRRVGLWTFYNEKGEKTNEENHDAE